MSDGWCPFAVKRALTKPNFEVGRRGRAVKAVVLHVVGVTAPLSAVYNTFNGAGETSAHFCIGKDSTIEQYVSIEDTAWANGLHFENGVWLNPRRVQVAPTWQDLAAPINPNLYTISVEHQGVADEPWTPEMTDANTRLLQWIAVECGLTYVPHRTLIGHCEIDPVDRPNCPGPRVDFEVVAVAGNARAPTPEAEAARAAAKLLAWLPISTDSALYSFAQEQDLGYPETDEFRFAVGDARYVGQAFQRGVAYVLEGEWSTVRSVTRPSAGC